MDPAFPTTTDAIPPVTHATHFSQLLSAIHRHGGDDDAPIHTTKLHIGTNEPKVTAIATARFTLPGPFASIPLTCTPPHEATPQVCRPVYTAEATLTRLLGEATFARCERTSAGHDRHVGSSGK
jgi:hypothetical protein